MLSKGTIVVITSFLRLGLVVVLTNVVVRIWNYWTIRALQTPTPSEATGRHIPLQPVPIELSVLNIRRTTVDEGRDKAPEDWEVGKAV